MASFYRDSKRDGFRAQVVVRGVRRKLWVGNVTQSAAKAICDHLDRLKIATETATQPPAETTRWANTVCDRIRKQLAKWGLIELGASADKLPRTVGDYSQYYLTQRTDIRLSTSKRLKNARRHLLLHWPPNTTLAAVTPGDCDHFARQLRKQFKPSHAGKLISDARQIFNAAVRHRLIADNPFAGIDCSQPHDKTRESYLPVADALRLIAAADTYYAAVIAFARFGGLRCPSEHLALTWADVDWELSRVTIRSPKTGNRTIPLFPELRPRLQALWDLAPVGSVNVFQRARVSAGTVWRSQLIAAIHRAKLDQWPKLWQNMRASCRTDLESTFPEHVVNYWLGHSGRVGRKHYDRIHDEHFAAAVVGHSGGFVGQTAGQPARQHPTPYDTNQTKNAAD